jgi:hypothetical protein
MERDEPVEQRADRGLIRRHDLERAGVGFELLRLPPDLVSELRGQTLEVLVPRPREREERRRPVLIVVLEHAQARGGCRVEEQAQPGVVLGQTAQIGGAPVVPGQERADERLRDLRLGIGDPDGAHVVGHLRPAQEAQVLTDAFERDRGHLGTVVFLGEGEQEVIR